MKLIETPLEGVLVLQPAVFRDERGFFLETFNRGKLAGTPLAADFAQDNHSRSSRGVVRGLHYQIHNPQGKLVHVARGAVFDVAVDIRRGSPSFGRWYGTELNDENLHSLWVPPGFAHGFCVLSEVADVTYKCTGLYNPADDRGIRWDDPAIGITWPVSDDVVLSDKDRRWGGLEDARTELPSYR